MIELKTALLLRQNSYIQGARLQCGQENDGKWERKATKNDGNFKSMFTIKDTRESTRVV